MPLAFRPSPTVAPRLLCPYSTEDKAPWLMVKQFFTARNTQRNFQSYIKMIRWRKEIEVTLRRKGREQSSE